MAEVLKLSQFKVDSGHLVENSSVEVFKALLNPENIGAGHSIGYSSEGKGASGGNGGMSEVKYQGVKPSSRKMVLLLDGTGVIPNSGTKTVEERIKHLRAVAYDYVGPEHETPIVEVVWGEVQFFARMTTMDVEYTLFSTVGIPLRAKVSVCFRQYRTSLEIQRALNRSSPDLTHLVTVREGDTLPLLCQRIYKDSSYDLDVARFNNLTNTRRLEPGTMLRFPPLAG